MRGSNREIRTPTRAELSACMRSPAIKHWQYYRERVARSPARTGPKTRVSRGASGHHVHSIFSCWSCSLSSRVENLSASS